MVELDEPAGIGAAAEQLYAQSPEEFVETRTALAKQAREAKDRPLATAIGALRRPTRSAWLVNVLARDAADDLGTLLEIGAALRDAQEHLDADQLRSLSQDRRRAVDALLRRAVALGADRGYEAPEAVRQEVTQTLQAALADPAASDQVRRGVLAQPLSYGGFGPLDLAAVAAARTPVKKATRLRLVPTADDGDEQEAERVREQAERAERAAELEAATATAEQARRRADEATAQADRLAEEVDDLRRRLAETERAATQAQREARTARREAESAESARAAAAERAGK